MLDRFKVKEIALSDLLGAVKRGFKLNKSSCYADALVTSDRDFPVQQLHVADVHQFDRATVYPEFLKCVDVFSAAKSYHPIEKLSGLKVNIGGTDQVFLPPVVECYARYNIVVAGLDMLYSAIDTGIPINVLYVRSIVRKLPPHPYLPESIPDTSLGYTKLQLTARAFGEHRHFVFIQ